MTKELIAQLREEAGRKYGPIFMRRKLTEAADALESAARLNAALVEAWNARKAHEAACHAADSNFNDPEFTRGDEAWLDRTAKRLVAAEDEVVKLAASLGIEL